MPELPEVETVRRGLDPLLRGRAIEEADIRDGRLTAPEDPVVVGAELLGEALTGVGRRGKYLLFGLDSGRTLVVHLRMTGWFHHRAEEGEELAPPKFAARPLPLPACSRIAAMRTRESRIKTIKRIL